MHTLGKHTRKACWSASALIVLLVALLPGAVALAGDVQNPWLIGIDIVGNGVNDGEDDDALAIEENGNGGALQIGYQFTPSFALRLYASGATHKTDIADVDILFSGGTVEAMYLFRPGQSFRPYLFGGLGGYAAESQRDEFTYSTEGPGASFGGGLYHFFTPHVSLHASARLEFVNWDTAKVSLETATGTIEGEIPIDESGSAAKLTLGMGFWF